MSQVALHTLWHYDVIPRDVVIDAEIRAWVDEVTSESNSIAVYAYIIQRYKRRHGSTGTAVSLN